MRAPLAAVVPAAGRSRRMGAEKVLLPFGATTVLETVLVKLNQAGVSDTVVVLRGDLISAADLARRCGARVVLNDHPQQEMLTSIRLGTAALPASIASFFLWPADHPAVSLRTLATLAAASDRKGAVIPCHHGRRGHPALIGADLRPEIEAIPAEKGLRHLWRMYPEAVREIEVEDQGVLLNIDTPEEYRKALERGDNGDR